MAGASRWHNLVAGNLGRRLSEALDGRPCEVYPSDMRLRCPNGLGTYPDVSIACGPKFEDERTDTLLNPTVIFEVLSPSTEAFDWGKKSASYRTLPSLKEYVLVSQDHPLVEHYARQSDFGQWLLTIHSELNARLELPALSISIPLAEIYARVEFVPQEIERSGEPR